MQNIGFVRAAYTEELRAIEHDLLEMGARAEHMVEMAVDSLTRLDNELAMEVLRKDDEIDEQDLSIESRCLRFMALQQPLAGDFRIIGTALKVITDIERIGDLAVDVAKIGMKIEKEFGSADVVDIPRMGALAREMLRLSLQAYSQHDTALIDRVNQLEDEVDEMYRVLRGQIFENMKLSQENVITDGWLLMAIHHVERIADHALNISERVKYMVTGTFRDSVNAPDATGSA